MNLPEAKPIALFDMDGSLADYVGALVRDMNLIRSPHEPVFTRENLFDYDEVYLHERMHLIKKQQGWWLNLKPIDDGIWMLELAFSLGFDCQILTKGPKNIPNAWKEKVEWCQKIFTPSVDIHITSDKGMVYGKVLYDDYPDYMERWLRRRPRGLGIMPATPYNGNYSHPRVVRFDGTNMDEVADALKRSLES